MREEIVMILDEDILKTRIDTLRDVLNEMCCTFEDHQVSPEKLIVSRQLDELIVEYMQLKRNQYPDKIEEAFI